MNPTAFKANRLICYKSMARDSCTTIFFEVINKRKYTDCFIQNVFARAVELF